MKAMVLERIKAPLVLKEVERPRPAADEVLIKVIACGVCRTDLHIVDGELTEPKLPLIPGHQVVGTIVEMGAEVSGHAIGERVGVPWLGHTCQVCPFCRSDRENLCDNPLFTGYTLNGGYAEYCTAHADYIFPVPARFDAAHAAPLLCAGLIGYRAFRLAGSDAESIGLYGFGSSAHILLQVLNALHKKAYVFTRPGDAETQDFARKIGAVWAGGSDELPPELLDSAIIFAPDGALYPQALRAIRKGGRVLSAGIHMSPIPTFPYSLLWEERSMSSVANLTRQDGRDFLNLAAQIPLATTITTFPLASANTALAALRSGKVEGSVVLTI